MIAVISFISQKGGVGKTTSAINLSYAFAIGGYKVLLIDFDSQGSVASSLKKKRVELGCKEILTRPGIALKNIAHPSSTQPNLDFIFSNIYNSTEEKTIHRICNDYEKLETVLNSKTDDYHIMVIDAPASTSNLVANIILASQYTIIPLQCEKLAIASLNRFVGYFQHLQSMLKNRELKLAGLLMTMYKKNNKLHRKVCQEMYGVLGNAVLKTIIPYEEEQNEASALGTPIIAHKLNSPMAITYINLMHEIEERYRLDRLKN